ncbi:MAG: trypsin-like peptidase domain-containing protein [Granulosicoccus sp.]
MIFSEGKRRYFSRSSGLAWAGVLSVFLGISTTVHAESGEIGWARTVSRVADSVVSLQLSHLRAFDGTLQGTSTATGFVVDAKRGIVLTNRHVVGSGPIRISATFQNQERVDAVPLYRDPIHDFAFVRFDPADLDYARPASLALRPDKVRTGMNIRVIGADGGEQLSILPGTIARLDREVPSYGRYGYNDFNTFYMQAASGTSGGSSGSPVIDFQGDVVALNAAANVKTASSFFLPLQRIKNALQLLQADADIERGGFQTLFSHQPFRQLRRLGLDKETEQDVRKNITDVNGMLIVSQVIPGGVAENVLESGDILFTIGGEMITDFVKLEGTLDNSIGKLLSVDIIRQGKMLTVELPVADLHALAPAELLELGDAVLQDMSIQHARAMNRPQRGVVVMQAGYVFTRANVPEGAVIVEVEGREINNLQSFIDAINDTSNISRKRVRYIVPGREFSSEMAQFQIDNRWFSNRLCARRDDVRFWNCESVTLKASDTVSVADDVQVQTFLDPLLNRVAPAMVKVSFSVPYSVENIYARHFTGVGLVLDADQGIIAVDRNTVPIALGDVELTFFGSIEVPGTVVFVHPRHNVALLQYDTSFLHGVSIEALELGDATNGSLPDALTMVGYRADGTYRSHDIDDISPLTVSLSPPGLARFQQSTLDVFGIPNVPPSLGGPLVDTDGKVHAVYMSFAFEEGREIRQREWAMPAAVLAQSLRLYRAQQPYFSIDARLAYRPLHTARQLGLSGEWLARYNQLPADARRVLYIEQVIPGTDAAHQLFSGDILLAIDDELVSNLLLADSLVQRESVKLTVLRAGAVEDVQLKPSSLNVLGTQRMVSWAGANFQMPFTDIGFQKNVDFPGVYVADTQDGSPALWDRLYRNRFIVAIDDAPINNLDDFLSAALTIKQDQITRLTTISISGRKQIVTVKPEYNFWPTFEVSHDETGWQRIDY